MGRRDAWQGEGGARFRNSSLSFPCSRVVLLALMGCFLLGWVAPVLSVERFPPPEFESDYQMPGIEMPASRTQGMEVVDTVVFLGCLALATYLVLVKRSRRLVFVLMLFSLVYFGFYRMGCICAVGSVQDVSLAVFQDNYSVPLTVVVFFLAPLMVALFFGRSFCAGVCPLGAIQDVVLVKPVKVRASLERGLRVLPFVYLGAAILFAATGSAFIICEYDPFVSFFRRSGSLGILLLGGAFLVTGMFIGRPYCRFLCPYGALLSVFSRHSKWNVTLSQDGCLQCKLCEEACPFGAIEDPVVDDEAPRNPNVRSRILVTAVLLPLLVGVGAWIGGRLAAPMSWMNPTVALAERVAAEDAGEFKETNDASQAFRQSGRPTSELYAEALGIRRDFVLGGWILGGLVGFVVGAKLLGLAIPREQRVYDPDPASCLACGRCYGYCPKEISRMKRFLKASRQKEEERPCGAECEADVSCPR